MKHFSDPTIDLTYEQVEQLIADLTTELKSDVYYYRRHKTFNFEKERRHIEIQQELEYYCALQPNSST